MSLVLTNPPKKYWIAVDTHNLTTAHNLGFVGELFSMGWAAQSFGPELGQAYVSGTLDYLPYTRNPNQSQIGTAPFQLTAIRDYSVEVLLETARKRIDPLLPSRLSAVFAFDSIKQAVAIGKKVNRPVDEFELLDLPGTRVARANFEMVSLLRRVIYAASWDTATLDGLAERYWTQQVADTCEVEIPSPTTPAQFEKVVAKTKWEFLVEGRLRRVGGPLWQKATASGTP